MADKIQSILIELIKKISISIINNSYYICLVICFLALILYIAGIKKAGKYVSVTFIIYFVLQSLRALL